MATLVITCGSCGTKFRLESEKLKKSRNKVRCSKCRNVFLVEQPDEDDLIHIEISEEETSYMPEALADGERQENEAPLPPRGVAKKRSFGKPYLIASVVAGGLVVALALIFALGGRGQPNNPKPQPAPVKAVKPDVTISENVKAYYLENSNTGEVLVIEGKVINKSGKPVSFIMVRGKLFNRKDVAVLTQSCYAGNPLSRSEINRLKFSEIQAKMMNREGQNLKDVKIPPNGEAPFVLVFHDLPEIGSLTNYSVNVVSSQFDQ